MSKTTKALIIICSVIMFAFLFIIVIIPTVFKTPDVKVPDVSGLSVRSATKELEKAGLSVETKVKDDYTDEVDKGKVSKTLPGARETVKKVLK